MHDNTSLVDFDIVKTDMSPDLDAVAVSPRLTSLPHTTKGNYKQTLTLTPSSTRNNAHALGNSYYLPPYAPQALYLHLVQQIILNALM
jgi:hypothetical protein